MIKTSEIIWVFTIALLIYFSTAAGYIDTIDADASLETARSIRRGMAWSATPEKPDQLVYFQVRSATGEKRYVSKMGLIHPLLYLPAITIGGLVASLFDMPADLVERFFISLVNPILTAIIIGLFYVFLRSSNIVQTRALFFSAWLGLGTLLLPYSKSCHRDIFLALTLLGAFAFYSFNRPTISGIFAMLAILTKPAAAISLSPIILFVLLGSAQRGNKIRFLVPIFGSIVIWLFFNFYWTGSALSFGYSKAVTTFTGGVWKTPVLSGVYKQLLSPETGLLYFDPLLILSTFVVIVRVLFRKKRDTFETTILASVFITILFYSRWWSPTGDVALGPRYLVSMIPLLLIVIALHFRETSLKLLALPLTLMVFLQIANTSIKPQLYSELRRRSTENLTVPHSYANIKLLKSRWKDPLGCFPESEYGGKASNCVSLTDAESLRGFNYWWWHLGHT